MKLTSIDLRNHLSHEATRVDFDGARLVTISGANGAGKSSLLEALKYVLFDDGRGRTDDLVRLGATDMAASVEFDFAGGHYRAVRGRTTKSGGRSYLELAIADGTSWRPLTGDDIRATQARIRELLGMDADTFATAVFLGQGRANRFAEATAGDRKRILGQVLGLERYERAERVARDGARVVDTRIGADRNQAERLDARLANRASLEEAIARDTAALATQDAELAGQKKRRGERETLVRDLAAKLATYEQAERDVAGVEARMAALRERFLRTRERRRTSEAALAVARATVSGRAAVDAAIAVLPKLRAGLDALEAADAGARALDEQLRTKRDAHAEARIKHDRAVATWQARYDAARRRADELEAAGKALPPVVCEQCGHKNYVDQANVRGRLAEARAEAKDLAGGKPEAPLSFARDEAAIVRLEAKRREVAADPERLRTARQALAAVERDAARLPAIEAAEASIERELAAIVSVDRELADIDVEGKAGQKELGEKKALAEQAGPIRAARSAAEQDLVDVDRRIAGHERSRAAIADSLARHHAGIEELDRLDGERAEISARIAAAEIDLARLRKLVTAFSVTGIPARIIEGVLPELGRYANELLAELRPGMTLDLRAQRAKRDGSGIVEALDLVVRDGAGERPLVMFSGGERMSVSLAIAVGLSRLVARRAGTAIRTLVVDEPDGLDADARRAFGQAIRILAHQGELERVVVVSHHEDLAEIGDAQYRVTKDGRGSVVSQIA